MHINYPIKFPGISDTLRGVNLLGFYPPGGSEKDFVNHLTQVVGLLGLVDTVRDGKKELTVGKKNVFIVLQAFQLLPLYTTRIASRGIAMEIHYDSNKRIMSPQFETTPSGKIISYDWAFVINSLDLLTNLK